MKTAELLFQRARLHVPDAGAPILELVNVQYAGLGPRQPKDVALTLTEEQTKAFSELAAR